MVALMDETLQVLFCRVWIMRFCTGSKWSKLEQLSAQSHSFMTFELGRLGEICQNHSQKRN